MRAKPPKDTCPSCFQPVSATDFLCASCELIIDPTRAPARPTGDVSVVRRMLEAPQRGVPKARPSKSAKATTGPTRVLDLGHELTSVPVVVATLLRKAEYLSELEAWVVSLIDGAGDGLVLARKTRLSELELRAVLSTLHHKQIIDFADEALELPPPAPLEDDEPAQAPPPPPSIAPAAPPRSLASPAAHTSPSAPVEDDDPAHTSTPPPSPSPRSLAPAAHTSPSAPVEDDGPAHASTPPPSLGPAAPPRSLAPPAHTSRSAPLEGDDPAHTPPPSPSLGPAAPPRSLAPPAHTSRSAPLEDDDPSHTSTPPPSLGSAAPPRSVAPLAHTSRSAPLEDDDPAHTPPPPSLRAAAPPRSLAPAHSSPLASLEDESVHASPRPSPGPAALPRSLALTARGAHSPNAPREDDKFSHEPPPPLSALTQTSPASHEDEPLAPAASSHDPRALPPSPSLERPLPAPASPAHPTPPPSRPLAPAQPRPPQKERDPAHGLAQSTVVGRATPRPRSSASTVPRASAPEPMTAPVHATPPATAAVVTARPAHEALPDAAATSGAPEPQHAQGRQARATGPVWAPEDASRPSARPRRNLLPAYPETPRTEPPIVKGATRNERTDPRIAYTGAANRAVLDALKQVRRADANKPSRRTDEGTQSAADALARDTLQVALRMEQGGRFDEAIRFLEKSIAQSPDAAVLYNRLGIILMRERADLVRAERVFRKALELAPDNGVFQANLRQVIARQALHAQK